MKKKKNAFTLIELLAIIVILAIIAVITVPIILNIIENSRKGAATDSAYGFKDSVNKTYVAELQNHNKLKLNDTYTVTNGTLSGGDFGDEDITSLPVSVSGTIPSSGSLTYSNNVLTSGCLVVGDYAVIFADGSVSNTEKGECPVVLPTMDEMCPGCVFAYTTSTWYYTGENQTNLESKDYKENYNDVISESGKNNFLGLILDDSTKKITNAFACYVENGTPFCIEGTTDGSKDSKNRNFLVKIYGEHDSNTGLGCFDSGSYMICNGSLDAYSYLDGNASVYDDVGNEGCYVGNNGAICCGEG